MTKEHRDPRDTFSGTAHRYLASTDHQSGQDLERIRELAALRFPSLTVDVACGAGHALRAAFPFSGLCVAVDLTMEMLRVARGHLVEAGLEEVRYVQGAAHRLPLAGGTVSLLTCRIAPHHFPSVPRFLREGLRVLDPEGWAVIIDSIAPPEAGSDRFINDVERLRDPSHVRSHTLAQWLEFLREAGFEMISVELFEREHPFREWAARTGRDEDGIRPIEEMFLKAPPDIREKFKVQLDHEGKVLSYTDEKGIFVLRKGKG